MNDNARKVTQPVYQVRYSPNMFPLHLSTAGVDCKKSFALPGASVEQIGCPPTTGLRKSDWIMQRRNNSMPESVKFALRNFAWLALGVARSGLKGPSASDGFTPPTQPGPVDRLLENQRSRHLSARGPAQEARCGTMWGLKPD